MRENQNECLTTIVSDRFYAAISDRTNILISGKLLRETRATLKVSVLELADLGILQDKIGIC